jgi:hypothetical protein
MARIAKKPFTEASAEGRVLNVPVTAGARTLRLAFWCTCACLVFGECHASREGTSMHKAQGLEYNALVLINGPEVASLGFVHHMREISLTHLSECCSA